MTRLRYIHLIQLIAIVLICTVASAAAFARPSWQRRPREAEATLSVTEDLSGEGETYESARQHISSSTDVPVASSYECAAPAG